MFSSPWGKRLFGLLGLLMMTGSLSCTPRIGESPPPQAKLEMAGSSCLPDAAGSFGRFFEGSAQNEEITQAWSCAASTFYEFKKYIRGREADRYSPHELGKFVEDNFLARGSKISDALMKQMMKIKVILVGGSEDYLLHNEIDLCISMVNQLSQMSIDLNPFMKVLTLHWLPQIQMENDGLDNFEKANLVFQKFIQQFSDLVSRNNPSYNLNDLVQLLREFENFNQKRPF